MDRTNNIFQIKYCQKAEYITSDYKFVIIDGRLQIGVESGALEE